MIRGSVLAIAAAALVACGGSSSGGGTALVSVPNVEGDTQAAATTAITGAGLELGTVTMQTSSTVASGNVISESPVAGTSVASSSAVNIVVSTGVAASVSVPNVVGDTQAAATTAITGPGLVVGTVTMQSSSTVASGNVISEDPVAGTSVASGSAVNLVVSSGAAASVSVPNVVGDAQAAATTAITGAGLVVSTVTTQASSTVASGNVISESPVAGTSVASGSAVSLVVSSGAGGSATYSIGGLVIGLASGVTVTVQNGADTVPVSAYGSFTFPTALASGAAYSVSVKTQPTGQTCALQNASGTVGSANVTNVVVYCTFNVTTATLSGNYDFVGYNISQTVDGLATETFGAGSRSGTVTVNTNGTISTTSDSSTYTVAPNNAQIPVLTDGGNNIGAILGADGDAFVWLANTSNGDQPAIAVGVSPLQGGNNSSVDGTWTAVSLKSASPLNGGLDSISLSNGNFTDNQTKNSAGTITTNTSTGSLSVSSSGAVSISGGPDGFVSADGDLIVLTHVTSGQTPGIHVAVKQGSGVTAATLNGVYCVVALGGTSASASDGKVFTLYAYGDGTYTVTYTENAAGTVTTNNTGNGTYSVSANGALTVVGSSGDSHSGAVSADGNVVVLANITSGQTPTIFVGVRQ